jgi:hypothetical protein
MNRSPVLYIFAGFNNKDTGASLSLHAGGLLHLIENVEELGILETEWQIRKTGCYVGPGEGEKVGEVQALVSDKCVRDGITWAWFPDDFTFGNRTSVHTTAASRDYRTVVEGTDLTLAQFLSVNGATKLASLSLEQQHIRHAGYEKYEARWALDSLGQTTCPKENHRVHLTFVVMEHPLPNFAYERLRLVIEEGASLKRIEEYSTAAGHHFSTIEKYDGRPAHRSHYAV